MSVNVMSAIWHNDRFADLKGNAMLAMLALADIANDEGEVVFAKGAKRSQGALARKARMSVATFRRATADLAEAGLLVISRESQRTENEYRILVTAQVERSGVSGQGVQNERSERSLVSGHSSIDVLNVSDVLSLSEPSAPTVELTPTGKVKKPTKTAADFEPEVLHLSALLAVLVRSNDHRVDTVGVQWWNACRLLHEKDGWSFEQIEIILRWSTSDPFWSANIRSMPTLREKFTTLRARRNQELEQRRASSKLSPSERAARTLALADEQLAVGA